MKPNYFDQDAADSDDILLKTAIYKGIVPPGCLLGGPVISFKIEHDANPDPCFDCEGPRPHCGGRKYTPDGIHTLTKIRQEAVNNPTVVAAMNLFDGEIVSSIDIDIES